MSRTRMGCLTLFAMIAFAGNSLLARLALKQTSIDAAGFTSIRIVSGALALWLISRLHKSFNGNHRIASYGSSRNPRGSWLSALVLFFYAVTFSYAYRSLPTATGALLLFGAVQATMIGYGLWRGERLRRLQIFGLICAFGGFIALFLPGFFLPTGPSSVLMLGAGVAWGIYSLRGRRAGNPVLVTTWNFMRAAPMAAGLGVAIVPWASVDRLGFSYAIACGALTSGVGYIIWYLALRKMAATSAATVQLSVPVIAAAGGVVFLNEPITLRFLIASAAILGGIALVTMARWVPRSA